ncbi:hypothetical protein ACFLR4_01150 [Bacteroidota bacterium]
MYRKSITATDEIFFAPTVSFVLAFEFSLRLVKYNPRQLIKLNKTIKYGITSGSPRQETACLGGAKGIPSGQTGRAGRPPVYVPLCGTAPGMRNEGADI